MTVPEFLDHLRKLFPRHADEIEAWSPHYNRRLGRFSDDELAEAVAAVLDGWTNSYPPKPELFRAAAPEQAPRSKNVLKITRPEWPAVYAERDRLVAEWELWNAARLEPLTAFERWHLLRIVRDHAFIEAQHAAVQKRQPQAVDLTVAEWQQAIDRAASQRPITDKVAALDFVPLSGLLAQGGVSDMPEAPKALPGPS